jgi:aldose 1-epimerase
VTSGTPSQTSPSGAQWTIRRGDEELVVVEVGGGIRTYTKGGSDVVAGYRLDEMAVAGRGQQLMPWPNRVRDGRYSFAGEDLELSLTEPRRHNALHGLVRWAVWGLVEQTDDSLTVTHRLYPQPGWTGLLDLTIRYALTDVGLEVTVTARNAGSTPAPYGYGAHPYLDLGQADDGDIELTVPAGAYLEVEPERLLAVETRPVAGTAYDFRGGVPLGETALDTAFTDLARGPDGRWAVTVRLPAGEVSLWGDAAYPWLQVFTGRRRAPHELTNGLAVEPMTCPPDAFNSGEELIVLEPGQSHTGTWGIRPAAPRGS